MIMCAISSGDIEDEDEVLSWLTDENTLEIPGKIEEVNMRMLEKILLENEHIVVFFCKYRSHLRWKIFILNIFDTTVKLSSKSFL